MCCFTKTEQINKHILEFMVKKKEEVNNPGFHFMMQHEKSNAARKSTKFHAVSNMQLCRRFPEMRRPLLSSEASPMPANV